jgi:hypothetical protein
MGPKRSIQGCPQEGGGETLQFPVYVEAAHWLASAHRWRDGVGGTTQERRSGGGQRGRPEGGTDLAERSAELKSEGNGRVAAILATDTPG